MTSNSMTKPILIGCGCFLLLLVGSCASVVWVGNRMMNDRLDALATGQEIEDIVVGWKPPAPGEEPGLVTPVLANGFARTSARNCDGIADFHINLPGVHSAYEFAPNRVDVYMFPITKSNRYGLITNVTSLFKSARGHSHFTEIGDAYKWYYFKSEDGDHNNFYFSNTGLIVLRSAAIDIQNDFLKAVLHPR